ncbi:MAG: sensor histidine kinase N-terminal domain-containing protein [Azonexus sp.]|jgi:two-component system sensor histidine kinase QseC|nr:sensor histidine kinase N-terminal domain-containing protein [Azonexus sp.]
MTPPSAKKTYSLRYRLFGGILLTTLLIWCLTAVSSYLRAAHEAEELLDSHLAQSANLLLVLVRGHGHEDDLTTIAEHLAAQRAAALRDAQAPYNSSLEYEIENSDGAVLIRSAGMPAIPASNPAGYSDLDGPGDEDWRIFDKTSADGRYRVQVAQLMTVRNRVAVDVAKQTMFPVAIGLPLLLLLIYGLIRQLLQPLDRLASDIAARTSENLSPLLPNALPQEITPLVSTLNRLFSRLGQTLENERRFTADAAHELRTPLAALKVQTQVALLSQHPAPRQHALRQIEHGVDRATRLVNQLLRLARLDPMRRLEQLEAVDLGSAVAEALCPLQPQPGQQITVEGMEPPPRIEGDSDLLTIALRNLIDNAIRYGKADGVIRIAACCADGHCALSVHDDGPGVPPAIASRLGERFFRNPDNSVEGNGLGLTIVSRIAELHGARLIVANAPTGGFIATLAGLSLVR